MTTKDQTDIARLQENVTSIKETVERIEKAQESFVTQSQFWPVKAIAYGFVGLVLTGMVGYWVTTSLKNPCCATVTTSLNP